MNDSRGPQMTSIEECRQALEQVLRTGWPEVSVPVRVWPVSEPAFGDLTSDCCQRLASRLRVEPEGLAERIAAKLPPNFPGSCRSERGFFNVRLNSIEKPPWPPQPASESAAPLVIVLPPFPDRSERWELLPLVALALVQFLLARSTGRSCRLMCGGDTIADAEQKIDLTAVYAYVAERLRNAEAGPSEAIRETLLDVLGSLDRARVCVWLSPGSLAKRDFNMLYHARIRGKEHVVLQCPPRGRLAAARELWLHLEEIRAWREADLAALSFYLAKDLQENDFELDVPLLQESGNLLWFLASVEHRLRMLSGGGGRADAPSSPMLPLENLSEMLRRVAVGACLLRHQMWRAIEEGEVQAYISALDGLLRFSVAVFNNAPFRIRLGGGALQPEEVEIMSGVAGVLSDTIRRWNPWVQHDFAELL